MKKLKFLIPLIIAVLVIVVSTDIYFYDDPIYILKPSFKVPKIIVKNDKNRNGIPDSEDIVNAAKQQVKANPKYKSAYYSGGYPPKTEGVCTDLIWRALLSAGYNLKDMMDADIRKHKSDYPRISIPDSNIDFRRVPNQYVFFKKYAQSLTTDVKPRDINNLKQWQAGDIVVLERGEHIAIVSDKRRSDGVPYVIHSPNTSPTEQNRLTIWKRQKRIIGHFRIGKNFYRN
jgi:uncharacterized protein YijF (DUF1287 family)